MTVLVPSHLFPARRTAVVIASAVITLVGAAAIGMTSASAAPSSDHPTERTYQDTQESGITALDIKSVRRVAAVGPGKRLKVVVRFGHEAYANRVVDVYFSTDSDKAPEVGYSGMVGSGFQSWKMKTWTAKGKVLDTKCGKISVSPGDMRATARFDPRCLDASVDSVAVSVETYNAGEDYYSDYAPGRHKWLARTAAYAND